ncbi:hypothetical protein KBY93_15315 [Synechococcus sp. J7-Johnson]|uniref:hypothetical protein n=1 Tax=Synechococcus sp. J7-Johnson TaxID=2823737 RepID=UPI0020CFDFB9|nr:hypothetical protein [Synechococcus sp. J7-Johnson]MCP9841980.1 hypothetical protein [Synechococcus sp. J7-Johnson]
MSQTVSPFSVVEALPAWIGAVCAVIGLRTWQHQLHYKENYELARRLLRAAYKYRDAINQARFPFSYRSEHSDEDKPTYQSTEQESWSRRFEAVNASKRELGAELLEAEVVLGRRFINELQALFECDKDLYGCILEHLDSIGDASEPELITKEARIARRKIMFARLDYQDEFSQRVSRALEAFEQEIRPMLGYKKPVKAMRSSKR